MRRIVDNILILNEDEIEEIDEFEWRGYWWIPQNPNNKIVGTLKFKRFEGISLNIMGSFVDLKSLELEYPIILGYISDGEPITLYQNHLQYFRIEEVPQTVYSVETIFKGYHFNEEKELKVKWITIRFNILDEWTALLGAQIVEEEEGKRWKIDESERVLLTFGDDYEMDLYIKPQGIIGKKKLEIDLKSYIRIKWKEETHFNLIKEGVLKKLERFLAFATGFPVYPLAIVGILGNSVKVEIFYKSPVYGELTKFYEASEKRKDNLASQISSEEFKFSYFNTFVKNNLSEIFSNWFKMENELSQVLDLYFYNFFPIEEKYIFLNLTRALEGYHRIKMNNGELPLNEHNKRIKEIIEKAPENYKEWLKEKLKYSNEPSFRRRLKDLVYRFSYLKPILGIDSQKSFKRFIDKIVRFRNQIVHPKKGEKDILDHGELLQLIEQLSIILEACFMEELGFPDEEISSIFTYQDLLKNPHKYSKD